MNDAVRLYRPSNGTAGEAFITSWCGQCKRDRVCNGTVCAEDAGDDDYCPIVAATFAYDVTHPSYPREWCYNEAGEPVCTAFERTDAPDGPSCAVRDDYTVDMFGDLHA
ncbi:MAG TPA: hypothetical protein PLN31_17235 [Azoarcus taiwanensis]|nr:hypothetical protein [Azoarcus taiwanensis]